MALIESGGGGGSFFTKKLGPLPVWGWAAVLLVGYYLYTRSHGGSGSSAGSAATTIPTAAQETLSGPGGYYSGPWGGAPAGITSPTPGGGSGTSQQFGQVGAMSGLGFLPPSVTAKMIGTNPGTYTTTDLSGNNYLWLNPAEYQALPSSTPIYYEPTPGQFVSGGTVGKSTINPSGGATPIYVRQPG